MNLPNQNASKGLKKSLTLFDVYAICTGAMFSSGFFLLPGLAVAQTGSSAFLAYFVSGFLILPAMLSQAELSTAMPKAGGTYFFLDRSLGPLAGTLGGLGTWLALVLKSAFALIGMGAYLVIFFDVPIEPLAIVLTLAFGILNIVGAKETSGLQRILVTILVLIIAVFILDGIAVVYGQDFNQINEDHFSPFIEFGIEGFLGTVGLVFVSYAGLTKVASVAEEVQNPDRNIPLGMTLSLISVMFIYTLGVFVITAVIDPDALRVDLTPVATAAEALFSWIPTPYGVLLAVVSAVAAFASTGNAGILSASRYPLAMARDQLVSERFGKIGRFGTPVPAILVTVLLMIFFIVALDIASVAKLASAFQLFIFGFLNFAVIVMRESHIPSYVPGYRSPLYPWMQIFGILAPIVLITQMGFLVIGLTLVLGLGGLAWYYYYVHPNPLVNREGAIYHLFARLGGRRFEGLDSELRTILKEKGFADESSFEHLVTHADVLDLESGLSFEEVVAKASQVLAARLPLTSDQLTAGFLEGSKYGATPVTNGAALPHQRISGIEQPVLVLVRCREGMNVVLEDGVEAFHDPDEPVYALFFLVSPEEEPGLHLRTLAGIANRIDDPPFIPLWRKAETTQDLREALLRNDRFISLLLDKNGRTSGFIGKALKDIDLPSGVLVALIRRAGSETVPRGSAVLEEGDQITIIGDSDGIRNLYARFID